MRLWALCVFGAWSPFWAVGLALTPVSWLREWLFRRCGESARLLLHHWRPYQPMTPEAVAAAGFLARARRHRRARRWGRRPSW
jgi:hypothetical protein